MVFSNKNGSIQEYDISGSSFAPVGDVYVLFFFCIIILWSFYDYFFPLIFLFDFWFFFPPKKRLLSGQKQNGVCVTSGETGALTTLSIVCSLCNEAKVVYNEHTHSYELVGEPTEAALKVLVEKMMTNDKAFNDKLSQLSKADRTQACTQYYIDQYQKVSFFFLLFFFLFSSWFLPFFFFFFFFSPHKVSFIFISPVHFILVGDFRIFTW